MPLVALADLGVSCIVIAFDRDGRERADDADGAAGVMSARVLDEAARARPTDVFLLAHGWKADVPAAVDQYSRWIAAMWALGADRERLAALPGGFRPMWVGLHWPSQPWGAEDLGGRPGLSGAGGTRDAWAARLGPSPDIRAALEVIASEAARARFSARLTPAVRDAYRALNAALGLGADGPAAPPGDDREAFDPDAALDAEAAFAGLGAREGADILGPLRQLSFWTMKKRARVVGEGGMHAFVRALQGALADGPCPRVHLMGHSFGAIVASAIVSGPGGRSPLSAPVHSLVLVQGAMSLWSFAKRIPIAPEKSGYFHRLGDDGLLAGPVVTTRSRHDRALGRFYPIAAGAARDLTVRVDEYPRYGALGTFGAQGLHVGVADQRLRRVTGAYDFLPGTITNVEASDVIREGGGLSGAHSDIFDPEVAHMVWEAAGRGAQG